MGRFWKMQRHLHTVGPQYDKRWPSQCCSRKLQTLLFPVLASCFPGLTAYMLSSLETKEGWAAHRPRAPEF